MNDDEMQRCLEAGLDAVLEAGPIALEYFRRPMAVSDKRLGGQYDPVTEADRRIEALIRERLRDVFPGHRVVGEEHGAEGEGEDCWYIDPIDGTRAFISGMPTWGILLGLVVQGRARVGIMHQPYTGETWFAAPGVGARGRRAAARPAAVQRQTVRRQGLRGLEAIQAPRTGRGRGWRLESEVRQQRLAGRHPRHALRGRRRGNGRRRHRRRGAALPCKHCPFPKVSPVDLRLLKLYSLQRGHL